MARDLELVQPTPWNGVKTVALGKLSGPAAKVVTAERVPAEAAHP